MASIFGFTLRLDLPVGITVANFATILVVCPGYPTRTTLKHNVEGGRHQFASGASTKKGRAQRRKTKLAT